MVRSATLPISFRTSAPYCWRGTLPVTTSWPLFTTTLTCDGISAAPTIPLPFVRRAFKLTARWDELARIERTRRGIRLIFKDNRRPVVVGTPTRHLELARVVQTVCPVQFDPTLRPSSWTTV
jgi:hypothetical protein